MTTYAFKRNDKPRPSTIELAYSAGMFEGEGLIRITKPDGGGRSYVRCSVNNTDQQVVDELQRLFGGALVNHAGGAVTKKNSRPQVRWIVTGNDAFAFLSAIRAFLRTEKYKAKADLAIEFHCRRDELDAAVYHERMKALNVRGHAAPSNVRNELTRPRRKYVAKRLTPIDDVYYSVGVSQ